MALRYVSFVLAGVVLATAGVIALAHRVEAPGLGETALVASPVSTTEVPVPPAPTTAAPTGPQVTTDPMAGIPLPPAWEAVARAAQQPVATDASGPVVTDDKVFLVGDSILLSTGDGYSGALGKALQPLGWRWTMDAKVSRFPEEGLQVLRRRRREVSQVAVIFLGNNYGGDQEAFRRQVDDMLATLDGVPKILLVTVQEYRPLQSEVNDVLWQEASGQPGRVQIVDWAKVVKDNPGINGKDGLHLNEKGTALLAQTIADALGPAPS